MIWPQNTEINLEWKNYAKKRKRQKKTGGGGAQTWLFV